MCEVLTATDKPSMCVGMASGNKKDLNGVMLPISSFYLSASPTNAGFILIYLDFLFGKITQAKRQVKIHIKICNNI